HPPGAQGRAGPPRQARRGAAPRPRLPRHLPARQSRAVPRRRRRRTRSPRPTSMSEQTPAHDPVRIGIVSISDRASSGVYEDKGLPALQEWLTRALKNPITFEPRLIPDEQERISATLIELV